jgi:hypothetical protein
MNPEYVNLFECSNCDYWEEMPADEPRQHMTAELIELGENDRQYALYKCPYCNTQSWSIVVPKD